MVKKILPNLQSWAMLGCSSTADWEIRLEESVFITWRDSLNEVCLFFYGASKSNPGCAGGGGVLISANGTMMSSYAWGLGIESNNTAEFCALLQGLRIASSKGITTLSVFGDLRMLIQALINKKRPSQLKLALIYQKIQLLSQKFQSIKFYHVLRGLNSLADNEANKGSLLSRGILIVDGLES